MHKLFVGLITLIIAALVVSPMVFAMPTPPSGDDQNTGGIIVGDDNKQIVYSEHTDNNYNGKTEQNAKSVVNGNGNKVNTINNNLNVNGDVTNGATSVVNNQEMTFIVPKSTAYYGLDKPVTNTEIVSLYMGQVLIVKNDNGNMQYAGDKFIYTYQSSLPVLLAVVNDNEAGRAEFDIDVAPVYNVYQHKYEMGNLDTIYIGKYRSPQQQIEVTIPEDGRYSMVIDTRVSQALDGKQTPITADSVDVVYSIQKVFNGTPSQFNRTVIGNTDMYPILEDGKADTSV